jgi:Cysteine rich repeat
MFRFFLAFTLLSMSAVCGTSVAQARSGTAAEQAACTRDVQRYCRKVIDQGDFTILACLQEHRPKLSSACEQVLKEHHQ